MKLKEGKTYLDGFGNKVFILVNSLRDDDNSFKASGFVSSGGPGYIAHYHSDGRVNKLNPSKFDLIEEVT